MKGILESFFRMLINQKREDLEERHEYDEIGESDFETEKSTFAKIAEHHHEKLNKLRENFELFNSLIDMKFDEIMKRLRAWSGYGEDERLNFEDFSSNKNSDQSDRSLRSLNPPTD